MKLIWPDVVNVDFKVINQLSNIAKYEVYIDRQKAEVEAIKKYESIKIPNDLDYKKIKGLSNEILTKLELIRPINLLQASRIEGVTPAAMTLLNLHIKRKRLFQKEKIFYKIAMLKNRLNYDILLNKICVSRETCDLLGVYYDMLISWNKKINLVSRKSISTSWNRHFLDSAQLWLYLPSKANKWLDFGSGAGFPGLVIAFISKELKPDLKIVLVEKIKKKLFFK